jgi:hypothetical protein
LLEIALSLVREFLELMRKSFGVEIFKAPAPVRIARTCRWSPLRG